MHTQIPSLNESALHFPKKQKHHNFPFNTIYSECMHSNFPILKLCLHVTKQCNHPLYRTDN